jgi:hypothetical protein
MLNNIPSGWRPATIKLGVISLLAFCIFFAWPVAAEVFKLNSQWTCGPSEDLTKELRSLNEEVVMVGQIDDVILVTMWANSKTRTFTAVATPMARAEISCIIVHGNKLATVSPKDMI